MRQRRGTPKGHERLAAADYFRRYKKEERQPVRQVKVEEDQTLKQITDAWKKFRPGLQEGKARAKARYLLRGISYTAKDIEKFSLSLILFQHEKGFEWKAGYFLSQLINNCEDREITIHTHHLSVRINTPVYGNIKNVTINGDAGIRIGDHMTQGRILVKGDCSAYLGWNMDGGTVIVEGSAGSWVAMSMRGGTLHVNGDKPRFSKLFLHRNPKSDIKIYHKGKQLWPEKSDVK